MYWLARKTCCWRWISMRSASCASGSWELVPLVPLVPLEPGLAKLAGSASTGGSVSASATWTGAAISASWTVASAAVSGSEERQENAMAKASVETRSELGRMFFTDRCVRLRWDGWGRPGDGVGVAGARPLPRAEEGRPTRRNVGSLLELRSRDAALRQAGSIPAPPGRVNARGTLDNRRRLHGSVPTQATPASYPP